MLSFYLFFYVSKKYYPKDPTQRFGMANYKALVYNSWI